MMGGSAMHAINKFDNPVSERNKKKYNTLNEMQKRLWDGIDNLPKEKKQLQPIKRKCKPEIKKGTIFALLLPENVYMFGKIFEDNLKLPMIDSDYFVAFISSFTSENMNDFPKEIKGENILLGPIIIGGGLWKNGTFYTVGYEPLSEEENQIDYGFYKIKFMHDNSSGKMIDKGYIVNAVGEKIDYEPKYLDSCAYITIDGIERGLRQAIIANNFDFV